MNHTTLLGTKGFSIGKGSLLATILVFGLSACGNKEAKPGQTLARVNGEEITVLQLNEELQRSGVQAAQQEAASKQLLEALIDRQLLLNAATEDKVDRDPKVVQGIERAKALIIAQAYVQKKLGAPTRPTAAEIQAYYKEHPGFFSERKQLDMRQLVLATKDIDAALKVAIDSAKSLDEVAAYLDQHQLKYARGQLSRTSAELPPELGAKLLSLQKGTLFIIKEGERSLLVTIVDVKDVPASLEQSNAQIEQFLMNKKNKDAADAEVARLRAAAKIEYTNGKPAVEKATPASSAPNGAPDSQARGVAGLK